MKRILQERNQNAHSGSLPLDMGVLGECQMADYFISLAHEAKA